MVEIFLRKLLLLTALVLRGDYPPKAAPAQPTESEKLARSVAQKRTFSGNEFADLLAATRKR